VLGNALHPLANTSRTESSSHHVDALLCSAKRLEATSQICQHNVPIYVATFLVPGKMVIACKRTLHKETLYDLHSSINIINQEHTDNPVLKDSEYLMIKKKP